MEVKTWQMAIVIAVFIVAFVYIVITHEESNVYVPPTAAVDESGPDHAIYNKAIAESDPYSCAGIGDLSVRMDCVKTLAVYDPHACELLAIDGIPDLEIECYEGLLNYTDKIKTCKDFSSEANNATKILLGNSTNCFVIAD